jgi:glycine C-acetyltransferase
MYDQLKLRLKTELDAMKSSGRYKKESLLQSPQRAIINTTEGEVLNLCANNYLGLADDPRILAAAKKSLDTFGFGLASVRFICGTQTLHKQLEQTISDFLGMEDTILYAAAFDANGGLFEPLLDHRDAIISDSLNHASLIDGIRLCKAQRLRYTNNDMADLEKKLVAASTIRTKVIVTDGVFSMDGTLAHLDTICALAEKHQALVFVDDCHATGVVGTRGKGTHEVFDVMGKVDVITGTLGKALGGGSGGFTSGKKEIIEMLRQKSRPYLFSNTLAPPLVAGALEAIKILNEDNSLLKKIQRNTTYFRTQMLQAGFELKGESHPIVPIMINDDKTASAMAEYMCHNGIYVVSFSYPVVPQGAARIRVQISAHHTTAQLDKAIAVFISAGKKFGLL